MMSPIGVEVLNNANIHRNVKAKFEDSCFNSLTGTIKPPSNGPLHSNTVIGTLAVDGWAVTFGTAKRCLGGLCPCPAVPSSLAQERGPVLRGGGGGNGALALPQKGH